MTVDYDRNDYDRDGRTVVVDRRGGAGAWAWILGAIILAIIVGLIVWWLATNESAGPNVGVTIEDVTSNPDAYIGQTVTVSGEIDEALTDRAVIVGGDFFDEGLLVVTSEPVTGPLGRTPPLMANDVIQTSGEVNFFVLAEVEREVGLDFDDELFVEFEGAPFVMADQVSHVVAAPVLADEPLTATEFAADPDIWVGEDVVVEGFITELIGENAFVLSDGVLVLGAQSLDTLAGNELVVLNEGVWVEGTVQEFSVENVEPMLDYTLDSDLFLGWEGQPVIIANEILPAD